MHYTNMESRHAPNWQMSEIKGKAHFTNGVLPSERLLPRAWEMELGFVSKPRRTLQVTRS
jgi:hypothetical protein